MKYFMSTTLGCKDIEISKSEFIAKIQFLFNMLNRALILYRNRKLATAFIFRFPQSLHPAGGSL